MSHEMRTSFHVHLKQLPTAAFLHLSLLRNRPFLSEHFHGPDCSNILFADFQVFTVVFLATTPALSSHFAFIQLQYRKNLWNYGGKFHHCFRLKGDYFYFYFDIRLDQVQNNCSATKHYPSCLDAVPAIYQSVAVVLSSLFVYMNFILLLSLVLSFLWSSIMQSLKKIREYFHLLLQNDFYASNPTTVVK